MSTNLNSHFSGAVCPKCRSDLVIRSRRIGLFDQVISWLSFYPFRCQLCRNRFHVRQQGVAYQRVAEDRREYERFPVHIPATFNVGTFRSEGELADISIAGCQLLTEARLVEGELLCLKLQLAGQAEPVVLDVAIVRGSSPGRARLEFLRIADGERERLQQFIRQLIVDRAAGEGVQKG